MSRRTTARLSRVLLWLTLVLVGLGYVLLLLNRGAPPYSDAYILAFLPFSAVGTVVASRRPENPRYEIDMLIRGRLSGALLGVARETVQPAHASLWLRNAPGEGRGAEAAHGPR